MRTDITCAIKFRKAEDKPLHQKITGTTLILDINLLSKMAYIQIVQGTNENDKKHSKIYLF